MANIQESYEYLNRILPIINKEIDNVSTEIKEQEKKKENIEINLKSVIKQISDVEQEENQVQEDLNKLASEKAENESKIKDLKSEISKDQDEKNKLQKKIDTYNKELNEIEDIDPMVGFLTNLIIKAKGDMNEIEDEINSKKKDIDECNSLINKDIITEECLNRQIDVKMNIKIELQNIQTQCDKDSKQLGIEKTTAENFLLSLKLFKNNAENIAQTIKIGGEFKDESLISKENLQKEIKDLYTKYNRKLPSNLIE